MNSQTPRSSHFKSFFTEDNTILPERNKQIITRTVSLKVSEIDKMVDVYRWRAETQFPIAKIKTIELLPSYTQSKCTE
jgi:hypothetical protein